MLSRSMHNTWIRLAGGIIGSFICALGVNLFIVPMNLYTGGLLGFCQLARTCLVTFFSVDFGTHDIAGTLYFVLNLPLFLLAYKALGKEFLFKTLVCTVSFSAFYSIIPIPVEPLVPDILTSCLLGGILAGIGIGIVLTCGCSSGGLDIVGLYLTKRGSNFSVGRFSLLVNAVLYIICLILFDPRIAIYSIIYNFCSVMMLDRMHQQNINVQALIFTRASSGEMSQQLMEALHRGVTCWNGTGAYTGSDLEILCVCVSKYEIDTLRQTVRQIDPNAFITFQEGIRIDGNFAHRIGNEK